MVELPEAFVSQTRQLMGEERFARYLAAFDEEPPVSIRLNPRCLPLSPCKEKGDDVVPWCPLGLYLPTRPNFTFDPLLHAGCYYVQEAASMFIHHVLLSVESLELSDKCLELSDECLELRDFSSAPHHSTEVSQLSTEVSQHSTEVSQHSTLNTQQKTLNTQQKTLYILALDGVQDPGNLGTIIRVADWFGIDRIVCSADTADCWSPKVVQATMGSIARVSIVYTDLVDYLQHTTLPVCGTLLNGRDIFKESLPSEAIIVMGNEGNGISQAVRQLVTHPLLIPQYRPGAESLNVAIATAITCAEFRRRTTK